MQGASRQPRSIAIGLSESATMIGRTEGWQGWLSRPHGVCEGSRPPLEYEYEYWWTSSTSSGGLRREAAGIGKHRDDRCRPPRQVVTDSSRISIETVLTTAAQL